MATAPDNSAIDWNVLAALEAYRQPGKPSLRERLIALYEDSSRALVAQIVLAADRQDTAEMARAAHTLKSASQNLGALRVAACCANIEACVRAGDSAGALAQVFPLRLAHVAALEALALPDADRQMGRQG